MLRTCGLKYYLYRHWFHRKFRQILNLSFLSLCATCSRLSSNMSTECSSNEIAEYYACEIKKMSKGECSPYLRQKDETMEVSMPDIESIDGMKIHRVHLWFVKARDVYLEIYSDNIQLRKR